MNADGTGVQRLTFNTVPDLTPTWSPDGQRLVFHGGAGGAQLFELSPSVGGAPQRLTLPPGLNLLANWGAILRRLDPQ